MLENLHNDVASLWYTNNGDDPRLEESQRSQVNDESHIYVNESMTVKVAAQFYNNSFSNLMEHRYQIAEGTYGYGFLVPFFNGAANYSGQLARLDLEVPSTAFANPSSKFSQGNFDGQLHSYDLTFIDSELKGFMGGFSANRNLTTPDGSTIVRAHGYLVPFYNDEAGHFGKVVKVDLDNFGYLQTACTGYPSSSNIVKTELGNFTCFGDGEGSLVSVLDLTEYDDDLRGFMGGFEGDYKPPATILRFPHASNFPIVPIIRRRLWILGSTS